MKKFLIIAFAAIVFAACDSGNDDGDGERQITLPDQNEQTQQGYADDASTGGFTFTARSAWTANVVEQTRSSSVSWLRLLYNGEEKYSGAAGTFTLSIELETNYSGETRSATITITSGSDKITISVEQKGKTEEGIIPEDPGNNNVTGKLVKKITMTSTDPADASSLSPVTVVLNYDAQNRVTSYTNANFDGPGTISSATFTYTKDKVTADYVYTNSDSPGTGQTIYNLNADGNAISMESKFKQDYETVDWESSATFSYDANGYLVGSVELINNGVDNDNAPNSDPAEEPLTNIQTSKRIYTCTWSGGNMTKVVEHEYDDYEDEEWTNIEEQQAAYNTTVFPAAAYMVLGLHMNVGGIEEALLIFGKQLENLPTEHKTYGGSVETPINYSKPSYKSTYAYTWNGDDLVKIVETQTYTGDDWNAPATHTTTYTFEY